MMMPAAHHVGRTTGGQVTSRARWRRSGLYVMVFFAVATVVVALPMSFPFRQRVSIGGVTIVELFLLPLLFLLVTSRPRAAVPRGYETICIFLYIFLVWVVARGLIGVIEGNELVPTLRDMRHYLPFLTLPALLYLLNVWRPDPIRILEKLTKLLAMAYFVYTIFLVAVIVSPTMSNLLMMEAFVFRISSHTLAISMTLLLLVYFFWREKRVGIGIVAVVLTSVGITLLLAQARMSTAMLIGLIGLAVCLYTARTLRTRFIGIGLMMLSTVLLAVSMAFLLLNSVIEDFEQFTALFLERVERDQHGRGIWESMKTHSFGTEAYRIRVVSAASERPVVGYGEGAGVGKTMSLEEGAYIDSTAITMWFKNGVIGVVLFYAFWLAILRRLMKGYLRYRTRLQAGIASIAAASVSAWLLWSAANVFLMYGWVLYPIVALVAVWLFVLQPRQEILMTARAACTQYGRHSSDTA